MDFFSWDILGTMAGAVACTAVITQVTKEWLIIRAIPTQIWSYVVSLVILALAHVFGDDIISLEKLVLCLFNAFVVSLAANGGYEAVSRIWEPVNKE